MQSISYTTEKKAICRKESMRSNMVWDMMQQYCIINSISFPLLLRLARRTERLSRSRYTKMQLRAFYNHIHSPFIETKHTTGITIALVYSIPSHHMQQ